jgi:hypothetical protein
VLKNHKSAIDKADKVEARLKEEIEEGNYIIVDKSDATLISPLAALDKPSGDIRLIHDLRQMNVYANKGEYAYDPLQDTLYQLVPGMWLAKVDLQWAYRCAPIRKDQYPLTGARWRFKGDTKATTLLDTKFSFGARHSPAHYNRITKAVKRMMMRRGYNCSVWLDDFLLFEKSFAKCTQALKTLIQLLRSLGFRIQWKKVCDATQTIVFLGIKISTVANELSLDPKKAAQLLEDISTMSGRKRVSKKQLQQIAGKLNWAANVVQWGRTFIGSFFQGICQLNLQSQKMRVTSEMLAELEWWYLSLKSSCYCRAIWPAEDRQAVAASTDASGVGAGAYMHTPSSPWFYINWAIDRPSLANAHINVKELAIIEEALRAWAPAYPGHHVYIQTDNITAAHWVNKGAARGYQPSLMLKQIAEVALKYNITIGCYYIRSENNQIPDAISRLHQPGQLLRLSTLLSPLFTAGHPTYFLPSHMSCLSWFFLLPQVMRLLNLWRSWTERSVNSGQTLLQNLRKSATSHSSSATSLSVQPTT